MMSYYNKINIYSNLAMFKKCTFWVVYQFNYLIIENLKKVICKIQNTAMITT